MSLKFSVDHWSSLMQASFIWSIALAAFSMIALFFKLGAVLSVGLGIVIFYLSTSPWYFLFILGSIGLIAKLDQATVKVKSEYGNRFRSYQSKKLSKRNSRREDIQRGIDFAEQPIIRALSLRTLIATILVSALSIAYSFLSSYVAQPPFYLIYPPQMISALTAIFLLYGRRRKSSTDKRGAVQGSS